MDTGRAETFLPNPSSLFLCYKHTPKKPPVKAGGFLGRRADAKVCKEAKTGVEAKILCEQPYRPQGIFAKSDGLELFAVRPLHSLTSFLPF